MIAKYTKLFAAMYTGSMRGKSDLLLVFPYILANADTNNELDETPQCIADALGISIERVQAAIHELESPDPHSRTPTEDGRRLVRLDEHRNWGWRIVNRQKYWDLFHGGTGRDLSTQRVQRFRERQAKLNQTETVPPPEANGEDAHIPTLEEVIIQGQFNSVDEAACKNFFNYHNDNNLWLNRFNRLIKWRDKLLTWRDRDAQKRSAGGGNGHISPVAQKLAIEEELQRHPANHDSAFYRQDATDLEKADYRSKKKKLRELTSLIASGGQPT